MSQTLTHEDFTDDNGEIYYREPPDKYWPPDFYFYEKMDLIAEEFVVPNTFLANIVESANPEVIIMHNKFLTNVRDGNDLYAINNLKGSAMLLLLYKKEIFDLTLAWAEDYAESSMQLANRI